MSFLATSSGTFLIWPLWGPVEWLSHYAFFKNFFGRRKAVYVVQGLYKEQRISYSPKPYPNKISAATHRSDMPSYKIQFMFNWNFLWFILPYVGFKTDLKIILINGNNMRRFLGRTPLKCDALKSRLQICTLERVETEFISGQVREIRLQALRKSVCEWNYFACG